MTTTLDALRSLPDSLIDLENLLHLGVPLCRSEKIGHLDVEASFTLGNLSSVKAELWTKLEEEFGESLQFTVLHEEEVIVNKTSVPLTPATVGDLLRGFDADENVTLRLSIDKAELARRYGIQSESPSHRIFLYLFADRLPYLLSRHVGDCERSLWGERRDAQVVFLVCDQDVLLQGDYLLICGGRHLAGWRNFLRGDDPAENVESEQFSTAKMNSIRRANLRWETSWVEWITPLHFHLSNREEGAVPILSEVIANQCAALFLLYSAESTLTVEDRICSVYQRGQTPIRVPWPHVLENAQDTGQAMKVGGAADHLVSLIKWVYDPIWPTDRLLMTQLYLAEELRSYDPTTCFAALLRHAERFESDLQSRWKDFIGKKLDGYSEQERKFEEDIAKAMQGFDEQISAIIKSLVESGMAAAVAVTASFLTAFYKTPFNPATFTIGLCIYAAYVLIFPVGLGLTHQWGRFRASLKEFASRRMRIERRLEPKKVEEILAESQFNSNQSRVKRWLLGAVGVYAILIVAALLSAFHLPAMLVPATTSSGLQTIKINKIQSQVAKP